MDPFNTTMQSKHRSASCIVLRSQNSNIAIQPRYQDCPSDRHSANNMADQLLPVSGSGKLPSTAWSHMRLVCRKNTRCIASKDAGCPWQMQHDNVTEVFMLTTRVVANTTSAHRFWPAPRLSAALPHLSSMFAHLVFFLLRRGWLLCLNDACRQ